MTRYRCDGCGRFGPSGRFDATFRTADDREVHAFGVAAGYCPRCANLAIDPDVLILLGLAEARCISAIGSDPSRSMSPGWAA